MDAPGERRSRALGGPAGLKARHRLAGMAWLAPSDAWGGPGNTVCVLARRARRRRRNARNQVVRAGSFSVRRLRRGTVSFQGVPPVQPTTPGAFAGAVGAAERTCSCWGTAFPLATRRATRPANYASPPKSRILKASRDVIARGRLVLASAYVRCGGHLAPSLSSPGWHPPGVGMKSD